MPRWFFWFFAFSVLIAALLPYPPVKYLLAAAFGLVFLSFYRTAPERTLFLFLMGMPILDLIPPTLIPIPGLNPETIIILALFAAIPASKRQQTGPAPPNPFTAPIVYYAAVMIISTLRSFFQGMEEGGDLFAAVKNQIFYVLLAPIAFRLLHTREQLHNALKLIALICTVVALHAIWLTRAGILSGLMIERNRASGLVAGQPNLFGGFLAMMILIYVAVLLGEHVSFRERIGYVFTVVSMTGALLMTLSRGSWLALLVSFGVFALLRGARAIALVLVVALSAPLWIPQKVVERVQHTFEGRQSSGDQELEDSAQVRLDQWKALPEIVAESPLLGHGFRSFRFMWANYAHDGLPKAAHSTWVEFLAEEGILGIIAYLWLLWLLGITAFRVWRDKGGGIERDVALGMTCAICCLALLDTTGTRFRNREVMAYIWILGGVLARFLVERSRRKSEEGVGVTQLATTVSKA